MPDLSFPLGFGSSAAVAALTNMEKVTVVPLGDSIFQNGTTTSATTNIITARNFLEQAFARLGQRIRIVNNGGNSGDTTAQSLARWNTAVAPYDPSWVIADFGVNDFATPRLGTAVFADLLQMYTLCQQMGAKFLTIGSVAGGGFNVAANFTQYAICVDLCMQAAATRPGWYHLPANVAITDYSSLSNAAFAIPLANTTYDAQTHPSAYGAGLLSNLFYNFFNTILPAQFEGAGVNHSGANGDTVNLVSDGLAIDTTGEAVNGPIAGITGTYSGYWFPARSGAIASAMTQALRTGTAGQPGNWQIFTLSGATAAADFITYAQSIDISASGALAGDKFYVECDFDAAASVGTIGQLEIMVQSLDAAFNVLYTSCWNRINSAPEYLGWTTFVGRASTRSTPLTLTTNAGGAGALTKFLLVTVKVATTVAGQTVMKLGGVELRKLLTP